MTIHGKVGSFSRDDEHASDPGHGPVVLAGTFAAAQGGLPVGLILSENSAGALIPYEEVENENIGTGASQTLTYAATLSKHPVEPGSITATDGTETFEDDGFGNLSGSAGGTGTIDYRTGAISLTFKANPTVGHAITADYATRIAGVLDQNYDDTYEQSGLYIVHGTCRKDVLKVGAIAKAAPGAALLKRLAIKGIYAR